MIPYTATFSECVYENYMLKVVLWRQRQVSGNKMVVHFVEYKHRSLSSSNVCKPLMHLIIYFL